MADKILDDESCELSSSAYTVLDALRPQIQKCLNAGWSYTAVHTLLKDGGLDWISYSIVRNYVHKLKFGLSYSMFRKLSLDERKVLNNRWDAENLMDPNALSITSNDPQPEKIENSIETRGDIAGDKITAEDAKAEDAPKIMKDVGAEKKTVVEEPVIGKIDDVDNTSGRASAAVYRDVDPDMTDDGRADVAATSDDTEVRMSGFVRDGLNDDIDMDASRFGLKPSVYGDDSDFQNDDISENMLAENDGNTIDDIEEVELCDPFEMKVRAGNRYDFSRDGRHIVGVAERATPFLFLDTETPSGWIRSWSFKDCEKDTSFRIDEDVVRSGDVVVSIL